MSACDSWKFALDAADDNEGQQQGKHNQSSSTSHTSPSPTSGMSEDDDSEKSSYPISAADHDFIQAGLNLVTVRELENAVEMCKDRVLEAKEYSEERKWLVRHLIELRFRLEEARDAESQHKKLQPIGTPVENSPTSSTHSKDGIQAPRNKRILFGHHFELKSPSPYTMPCDQCGGSIWSVLQQRYNCKDCQFKCHVNCLDRVQRVCAYVRVCESPKYNEEICPEVGLTAQGYCCFECKAHITFKSSWVEPRLCDYDGRYYCAKCHWNSVAVIPARVLHNWDFVPRRVCCSCAQYLQLMADRPVLCANRKLTITVDELFHAMVARVLLKKLKPYLLTCASALKEKDKKQLMWSVESRMFDGENDIFSLQDLIAVKQGILLPLLQAAIDSSSLHVKKNCKVCLGKGFICEFCKVPQRKQAVENVIFAFDEACIWCEKCNSVYHTTCLRGRDCPRCKRRENCLQSESEPDISK